MSKYSFFAFAFIFVIYSCDPKRVYEKNINIPKDKWHQKNIIKFEAEITDTSSLHNIYINIRNRSEYPMLNLYLFIKTTSPLGFSVKDTFECILADEKGKWYGKGFGNIWSNQILYKQNVKFPFPGIYIFEYEQAMRIEKLPGIVDVGLRIEKINIK